MSRHTARRRALEILFSRDFHDTNDIQYSETEILDYAEDEKEPTDSVATVETVDCLDEHAVPVENEDEVLGETGTACSSKQSAVTDSTVTALSIGSFSSSA